MLAGTSKKKTVGKERGNYLPRPNSEIDLNEMEEDQYHIDNLSDDQVCKCYHCNTFCEVIWYQHLLCRCCCSSFILHMHVLCNKKIMNLNVVLLKFIYQLNPCRQETLLMVLIQKQVYPDTESVQEPVPRLCPVFHV